MKLKKIAALSLTTALALTMVACGGSGTNSNGATSSDSKPFISIPWANPNSQPMSW